MSKNSELDQLKNLVDEFERLDNLILEVEGIRSGDTTIDKQALRQALGQALSVKIEIKRILSHSEPINIDRKLSEKLKKIRDNYGYSTDIVIQALGEITGNAISQEEEEDIDVAMRLHDEGAIDYVDEGYYKRLLQFGTLILGESLPENFTYNFKNLRKCFALGLSEVTIIYCRVVIETGCFMALERTGRIKSANEVQDFREYSLYALMNSIKNDVYVYNWKKAKKAIKRANDILHTKRNKIVVDDVEAFEVIQDTFAFLEDLFLGSARRKRIY